MYREKENAPWRRINYAALDVEELGSVYESLLDFQPVFVEQNGKTEFRLLTGTERKSTGSYYTPPELVNELIQSALVRSSRTGSPRQKPRQRRRPHSSPFRSATLPAAPAISSLPLPAPSGANLRKPERVTKSRHPSRCGLPSVTRSLIVSMVWIRTRSPSISARSPFGSKGIRKANRLRFLIIGSGVGIRLLECLILQVLKDGIPDDAFTAVTGDDKAVARELKKQNKKERENRSLAYFDISMNVLTNSRQQVNAIADDKPEDIRKKKELFCDFPTGGNSVV